MIVKSQNPSANQVTQETHGTQFGQFAQSNEQGENIVSHGEQEIPPPPPLHLVHPGDLITAQYFNDLVLAVQNLQARMEQLEEPQYYMARAQDAPSA